MKLNMKSIGFFALCGAVASIIIMLAINATFGLIVYILAFAAAAFELYKAFNAERLPIKEFLQVAVKENLPAVATIALIVVAIWVFSYASAAQAINDAYDAYSDALAELDW